MQTVRCEKCGLSQLRQDSCKRCGRSLADEPAPARRPVRVGPPSRWRPYLTIWTNPRATIRQILDHQPQRAVILLAWLKGIADSLESGSFKSTSNYPWPFFVGIVLVVGPPFAFVRIYLGGALLAVAGRWLGGSADAEDCRAALAWSSIPQIAGLVPWAVALAILGDELFYRHTPQIDASPYRFAVLLGIGLLCLVLGIWSLAVRWKCLGEAHGFSAWRGFLADAIVMSLFVALIAAVIIALIALDAFPSPKPQVSPGP